MEFRIVGVTSVLKLTMRSSLEFIKLEMFTCLPVSEEQDYFFLLVSPLSSLLSPPLPLFLFFKHTSSAVFFCLWLLIVSPPSSLSFASSSLSLRLNHSVLSHTQTQRYMSGAIMDHVNAHETTRLESYCCRTRSEHTPLSLCNHIDIPLMPLSLSLTHTHTHTHSFDVTL